ncbi:MAG: hypothetical protein V3U54_07775 [Thermodesulfobacteriota bacterium]
MNEADQALRKRVGTIKDFWLGDNMDWQKELGKTDKLFAKFIQEDLKVLFKALDHYAVGEQELKDEIEYLRKKRGR